MAVSFEVVPTLYRPVEVADFSKCLEDGREWTRTNSSEMGFQKACSIGLRPGE